MGDLLAHLVDVLFGAVDQDDEVVRVADDPPGRGPFGPQSLPPFRGGERPARPPRRLHVLIKHRQRDVGQQRRDNPALRCPGRRVLAFAEFGHDPGLEERLDQGQHPLVLDPAADAVHQRGVIDLVEARRDVRIQHPPVTVGAHMLDLGNRVLGPSPRPEPIRDRQKVGLEDGLQHQFERGLDDPVGDHGNPQPPHLARPARFGNQLLPHRQGSERARLELDAQILQKSGNADPLLDVGGGHAVHARGPAAPVTRHPVKRRQQRRRVVREVEQVLEPAARIGHRPTVKLGLHLRYPPARSHRDLIRPGVPVQGRVFRHYSLQDLLASAAALPHVTGSPGLGVLRRLRPIRSVRRSMRLSHAPSWQLAPVGGRSEWFPCSL